MRLVKLSEISKAVQKLVIDANHYLPYDMVDAFKTAADNEKEKRAKNILYKLVENYKTAKEGIFPLCQETGIAVVFLQVGDDLRVDGNIYDAINKGIETGYAEGFLRKSIADPLTRINTNTNTPAIIHTEIIRGPQIKITLMTKGAGAENKSALKMLSPADGIDGIKDFVMDTVGKAGAAACPPFVIGVGIGGNFETAPLLAKKALLRDLGLFSKDKTTAHLEKTLLKEINCLGLGPLGLGGVTTALAVNVETIPCHIASLPVAVNIQCHSARHKTVII